MELNFDKEMDALLRQTARHEKTVPGSGTAEVHLPAETHLDADELAAFSASALPAKARERAMLHLVDCTNCRTILSNLVFFEDREEEKTASATVTAPVVEKISLLDGFRGFFSLPVLAYGMAGLVAVFALGIGLMVFRGDRGSELARLDSSTMEKPAAAKNAPAETMEVSSNSAQMSAANAAANAPSISSTANVMSGVATMPASSGPGTGTGVGYAEGGVDKDSLSKRPTDGERLEEKLRETNEVKTESPVIVDGLDKVAEPKPEAAPPPLPVPAVRQDEQNTLRQIQNNDAFRNQQRNTRAPDGGEADRSRRSTTAAEAGADLSREARDADAAKQQPATGASKSTTAKDEAKAKEDAKKPAAKKIRKKNAEAQPSPTPEKKPDEENQHPPCR